MLPELLTPIGPEQAAQYILDSRFWVQEKRDGVRLIVRKRHNQIDGWNRQGQPVAVARILASALLAINVPSFVLDGELEQNGGYHCWDLLEANDFALLDQPYAVRYRALEAFYGCSMIHVLPSWTTHTDKETMAFALQRKRAEGLVFKNAEAPYRPGRAGQHYKLKFEKHATVRVRDVDPVRNRVSIEMMDGNTWHEVCGLKVTHGTVRPGDFVEVKYLYGTPGRRLVQPRFLCVRTDVSDADCRFSQVELGGKWQR